MRPSVVRAAEPGVTAGVCQLRRWHGQAAPQKGTGQPRDGVGGSLLVPEGPGPHRHRRAPTCVDGHSGLADDHLWGHRHVRPQPVQPLGHLQELGRQVERVQEPVAQEHDGGGGGAVPGQDGGLQGHLEDSARLREPGRGAGAGVKARPAQPGPKPVFPSFPHRLGMKQTRPSCP